MEAYYTTFKAIHLIFVVSWFAGLFYIIRLFIYHVEAQERPDIERRILQGQYKIMERRLWNVITVPASILTLLSGIAMFISRPYLLEAGYMHIKLGLLLLLYLYHGSCWYLLKKLKQGQPGGTSIRLRMWNEVATLLLVAIIFVVVLKSTSQWLWGVAGIIGLGLLFMVVIKLVNKDKS